MSKKKYIHTKAESLRCDSVHTVLQIPRARLLLVLVVYVDLPIVTVLLVLELHEVPGSRY